MVGLGCVAAGPAVWAAAPGQTPNHHTPPNTPIQTDLIDASEAEQQQQHRRLQRRQPLHVKEGMNLLQTAAENFFFPKRVEYLALDFYTKYSSVSNSMKQSRALAAVCLYNACREENASRKCHALCNMFEIDTSDFWTMEKRLHVFYHYRKRCLLKRAKEEQEEAGGGGGGEGEEEQRQQQQEEEDAAAIVSPQEWISRWGGGGCRGSEQLQILQIWFDEKKILQCFGVDRKIIEKLSSVVVKELKKVYCRQVNTLFATTLLIWSRCHHLRPITSRECSQITKVSTSAVCRLAAELRAHKDLKSVLLSIVPNSAKENGLKKVVAAAAAARRRQRRRRRRVCSSK